MEKLISFISRHKYDIIRTAVVVAANFAVMMLLPAAVMGISSSEAGMMVCITLFFAVNPAFSLAVGIFAGQDIKRRWFTAAFPPLTFLLSARLVFGADASDFTVYAVIYAAISVPAMLFTFLIKKYGGNAG